MVVKMLRPYLKFLIAGGVVTGEGGGALSSGLMFIWLTKFMNSMSSTYTYTSSSFTMFTWIGIPFAVAGIISLIIGLSLLGTGVSRRKQWLAIHQQDMAPGIAGPYGQQGVPVREQPYPGSTRVPSFDQPAIRQPAFSGGNMRKRCINCGTELPDNPDTIYCPSCGHRI